MLTIELFLYKSGVEIFPEGLYGAKKYFQSAENKHFYFAWTEQWQPVLWCYGLHVFHAHPGTGEVSLISVQLAPDVYWCMRGYPRVSPSYGERSSYKVMKEPSTILLHHENGKKIHFRKLSQCHWNWSMLSYGHMWISPWQSHCSLAVWYAPARNLMCQAVYSLKKTSSQPDLAWSQLLGGQNPFRHLYS